MQAFFAYLYSHFLCLFKLLQVYKWPIHKYAILCIVAPPYVVVYVKKDISYLTCHFF